MNKIVVIGSVGVDIILGPVENWPEWGYEILTKDISIRLTGAAGNVATTFSKISKYPYKLNLLSVIGKDFFGKLFIEFYSKLGINIKGIKMIEGSTCLSIGIKSITNERSFFTHLGVLDQINISNIINEELNDSLILVCGFNLIPSMWSKDFEILMKDISKNNFILFDPGCPFDNWKEFSEQIRKILPYIHIFSPNMDEFLKFNNSSDINEAYEKFVKEFDTTTIIKAGRKGSYLIKKNSFHHFSIEPESNVKDTIGAGDAFNAGLLNYFFVNQSIEINNAAIQYASKVAKNWIRGDYWKEISLI